MNSTKKPSVEKNKLPHTRISFAITKEMESQIKNLAQDKKMNLSKYIRKSLEKSMQLSKEQSDIDFIRTQIREEVDTLLRNYEDEFIEIIKSIGMYVIPQCTFSADIIQMLVTEKYGFDFESIMEQAQKEALVLLTYNGDLENLQAYEKYHEN